MDLFSGIGGISLALKQYVRTVTYCEIDRYAQSVLLSRMQSGDIDTAPIWDDVRSLKKEMLPKIDTITGGFPCQDISCAGRGVGLEAGSRSGLFSEILRLTEEIRPTFLFLENVPAIRTRGLTRILCELSSIGYDCRWTIVSAAELGAPHLRKRWFLLAHNNGKRGGDKCRRSVWKKGKGTTNIINDGKKNVMAESYFEDVEGQWEKSCGIKKRYENFTLSNWWTIEPNVDRVVNGLPNRVDRIKCIGNAVVPQQAKEAFERLMGLK